MLVSHNSRCLFTFTYDTNVVWRNMNIHSSHILSTTWPNSWSHDLKGARSIYMMPFVLNLKLASKIALSKRYILSLYVALRFFWDEISTNEFQILKVYDKAQGTHIVLIILVISPTFFFRWKKNFFQKFLSSKWHFRPFVFRMRISKIQRFCHFPHL